VAQFDDQKKIVILSEAKDLLFACGHSNFDSLVFNLSRCAKSKLSHYPGLPFLAFWPCFR
jgi:hypothetical protein